MLTNGNSLFTKHLSNDERGNAMNSHINVSDGLPLGMLELHIISTSISTLTLVGIFRTMCMYPTNLVKANLFYLDLSTLRTSPIVKLFLSSLFCSWLHISIDFACILVLALTGNIETVIFRCLIFLARLSQLTAEIILLLILILGAKGYFSRTLRWKQPTIVEIALTLVLYAQIQTTALMLTTKVSVFLIDEWNEGSLSLSLASLKFIDQIFIYDTITMACNYARLTMYALTGVWFSASLCATVKRSEESVKPFFIFSIWLVLCDP